MEADDAAVVVRPELLREFVAQLFVRHDFPQAEAALVASQLVEADLRGTHTHGVLRVRQYLRRAKAGGMNPRPNITIVRETRATALLDGDGGAGQVVGARAMQIAIGKAKDVAVGYAGVRMSNHFGTCAHYAEMALPHDMIGVAATVGGVTVMAPWGGVTPLLGNNPLGFAIPAGRERPVVLDIATSSVLASRIADAARSGTPIPATWALDMHGEPTTDSKEASQGLVQPLGEHKGYGLAFVIGLLAGVLNGAAFGRDVGLLANRDDVRRNTGFLMMALDVRAFMDPTEFKSRVDDAVAEMRSSKLARGVERIFVPGEIEWLKREEALRSGVPIASRVWLDLTAMARESSVVVPSTILTAAGL